MLGKLQRAAWLLTTCLASGAVAADPGSVTEASAADKQAANARYLEAMSRFDEDDLDRALAGFRESYARVKSPNSHFMIARTLARLGQNVEAYLELEAVAAEADALGSKYADTASSARAKQEEIRGRVGLVIVTLTGAPKGTTVQIGEAPLPPAMFGKPYPVLPGETRVVTTAPDGRSDAQVIAVAAGKTAQVDARIRETAVETVAVESSHRPYLIDASVHVAGESLQPRSAATRGAGIGARVATELLRRGLIAGLDNNLALGVEADWIGTSNDPHAWLAGSLEWGFWAAEDLRLSLEPGVGVAMGVGTHLRPIMRLGGSYRIWNGLHVVARLGVPVATLGVAYVK